jgi:hypothetical protein
VDLSATLVEIEQAGWQALVDGTGRSHFRQVVDDHVVVLGPRFGVVTGEAAIDQLSGDTWSWFRLRAPQVVAITDEVATIAYRVIVRRDFDAEHQAVVSSTYRLVDGRWRLAVHQQTPM